MTAFYLVMNAGSSSVKFQVFAADDSLAPLVKGQVAGIGTDSRLSVNHNGAITEAIPDIQTHHEALNLTVGWLKQNDFLSHIVAVGHRIVYGGKDFVAPLILNANNLDDLERFTPQAPLHQPFALEAARTLATLIEDIPQIGCFDTAFHANHDPLYKVYALPSQLREQGICRYGFHGLSYEWIAKRLREDYPEVAAGKVVVAHLGSGASVCALHDGRSIDTSMGFTALDGLPMSSRCGSLDPGAVLFMIEQLGMSPVDVRNTLYTQSGLRGLSGVSGDMQKLLQSTGAQEKLAVNYFSLKVAQFISMMTTSLGGIDALVFTGGIGENSPDIREKITERLTYLNLRETLVIPTNEECMMALHMKVLLS